MRIAILMDQEDHVTDFEQGGIVRIYTKIEGAWFSERETEYSVQGLDHSSQLHNRIKELCQWMAPCDIIAAKKFRGNYRVIFDRYQVSMWAMEGFSNLHAAELLNSMEQFYLQQPAPCDAPAPKPEPAAPLEVRTGYFSVDLTDVMAHRTTLNSQQVLLPFFQSTKFIELEILCEHVPKWLPNELPKLNLKSEETIYEGKIRVKVFPV